MGSEILYLCSAGRHHIHLLSDVSHRHHKNSRKRPIWERSDLCLTQCSSVAGYLITTPVFYCHFGCVCEFCCLKHLSLFPSLIFFFYCSTSKWWNADLQNCFHLKKEQLFYSILSCTIFGKSYVNILLMPMLNKKSKMENMLMYVNLFLFSM